VTTLEVKGLVKLLGGARVLRGLDARFDGGTVHVIEGANGSGKSTMLNILAGRLAPTHGKVTAEVGGVRYHSRSGLRNVVGWLGHELGLYPDLSADENVRLHAELRGLDPDEAWARNATRLGIDRLRGRRVRELSRGQRQRVALLRLLVSQPGVLLLDEPSTGLDTASLEKLVDVLHEVRDEGRVVLVVTHDVVLVERLAGQRWRIREGKIFRHEEAAASAGA
jgi:ABC-type multidrug transport system ATPase subunit